MRRGLSSLRFEVSPIIYVHSATLPQDAEFDSRLVTSLAGFDSILQELAANEAISKDGVAEIRSVIEGAKALSRPQKRTIENAQEQKAATALVLLEAEIANFDQQQRRAALVNVPGPQRIRGLAGSGKTVILAMKAAHLHLTRPDEHILVTFFTRSLRASLKNSVNYSFLSKL